MGGNISNDIASESVQQIHSQNSWALLGRTSTKVVQQCENVTFLSFLLTWDHMLVQVSNDIFSPSKHDIHSPKFMHSRGKGL